ncbi:hypothetical protein OH77DRAFT_1516421 [Trametes cingulata]|nr:hypothetical protein OH77DRAFT_1516421 [Trametes cingulata]
MPPPSSVPRRPTAEPSSSPSVTPALPVGSSSTAETGTSYLETTTAGSSAAPQSLPPRITPTPVRMPPRIGSAQPSSSQPGAAISMPSRTMVRAPVPSPAPTPVLPVRPPPLAEPTAGPSYLQGEVPFAPPSVTSMGDPATPVPFPIDSSQIDPQLMGPSGLVGVAPLQPQDARSNGVPVEQRPAMGLSDVPAVKAPRTRRPQRKKSDATDGPAEAAGDQDDAADAPPKKKRSKKVPAEGDENADQSGTKKRKRSETAEPRRSRKRAPSPPPFDPEADPGEELDPTAVTMAALCDDNGRGRVSSKAAQIISNHAAWRAANREKRARMKAAMEAKKYGKNVEDDEQGAGQGTSTSAASGDQGGQSSSSRAGSLALDPNASASTAEGADASVEKGADGFDYGEDMTVSRFNVQVRIGANGETIIDEDSLFVNRNEEHQTEEYTHVEESDFTKFVNSATYSKKLRGSRWSAEETELFYDALSQFGENYELISYVLPGRDRKACKNKFKAEDKKNPARITHCLNNRRPYDIATLSRMTGKDFSGPTPEIRAPTPLRSTELATDADAPAPSNSPVVRKKSRTPSAHEAGVEIVGDIDDVGKDDIEDIASAGVLVAT